MSKDIAKLYNDYVSNVATTIYYKSERMAEDIKKLSSYNSFSKSLKTRLKKTMSPQVVLDVLNHLIKYNITHFENSINTKHSYYSKLTFELVHRAICKYIDQIDIFDMDFYESYFSIKPTKDTFSGKTMDVWFKHSLNDTNPRSAIEDHIDEMINNEKWECKKKND